jgi:hypothetical protein
MVRNKVSTGSTLSYLCLIKHHAMKGNGGIAPSFLALVKGGGEWSASGPGRFIPGERVPGTYWTEGWLGLRAGLEAVE